MLPKFHKKQGYDVEVIASLETFDKDGKPCLYSGKKKYINENDVYVTRLNYKNPQKIYKSSDALSALKTLSTKQSLIFFYSQCSVFGYR